MGGGKGNIKPEDGTQFSKDYQPAGRELWDKEASEMFFNDLISWMKDADENIFVNDFIYLSCDESKYKGKIYADLPNYLTKRFSTCLDLYQRALEIQKTKLVKFGVMDKLNAAMTKFTLINNHGWKDKTDVTTDGKELNASAPIIKVYNVGPKLANSENEIED
jgi:hypothetical protein